MEQFTINFYGKHAALLKAGFITSIELGDILNSLRYVLREADIDVNKLREPTITANSMDIAADD
jgi:hypothetical protein